MQLAMAVIRSKTPIKYLGILSEYESTSRSKQRGLVVVAEIWKIF